jgi:hypothetical protein
VGKKKKDKKKKKKGMLATLADAVVHPHDATRNLSAEGKLAGGIELAQLVTAIAALFTAKDNADSDGSEDSGKGLRERVEDLVDERLVRALDGERFERRVAQVLRRHEGGLRDEIEAVGARLDSLERKVAARKPGSASARATRAAGAEKARRTRS